MYELDKYKHEINADGELVVYDVPIFAEVDRNGKAFDEQWIRDAVANHQKRFKANGYMAPYHIEHNSLNPTETNVVRENIGRFLPKRVEIHPVSESVETFDEETGRFKSKVVLLEKAVPIADLVIKPEFIEDYSKSKWPWLSVEANNFDAREFSSLAALTSRPPEIKQQGVAIEPLAPMHFAEERFYFSEEIQMETSEQFGARELAQKMAKNWGSVKSKLMGNSAYSSLMNAISADLDAGTGPRGGWLAPENVASYIKSALEKVDPATVQQLSQFLFSEEENMETEKEQFAARPELEPLLKKYQSVAQKASDQRISGSDDPLVGSKSLNLDRELDQARESLLQKAKQIGISDAEIKKWSYGQDSEVDPGRAYKVLPSKTRKQHFSEEEDMDEFDKEQMGEGEGEGPKEKIMALLDSAPDEVLAQIIELLQGAGDPEMQAAENDLIPAPVEQFAELRSSNTTLSKKFDIVCDVVKGLQKEISAMKNARKVEEAFQFAEQKVANSSQKEAILKKIKSKKNPNEIREMAEFASQFAMQDPAPLSEVDLNNNFVDPQLKELADQYAPEEKESVYQFAEEWENGLKTVERDRFIRLKIKGYNPRKANSN